MHIKILKKNKLAKWRRCTAVDGQKKGKRVVKSRKKESVLSLNKDKNLFKNAKRIHNSTPK